MKIDNLTAGLLLMFFLSCAGGPGTVIEKEKVYDKNKNYLEDSKTYFNYEEYEKAVESALMTFYHSKELIKKEEALYIINESAEIFVEQLQRDLYVKSLEDIRKQIKYYKSKFDITIILEKIGYQYIIYYDKEYYNKLLSLNPSSPYAKKMELKHLARMGQFATNPSYRFKEIINVTHKYIKIVKENPKLEYAPDILIKVADLYLYLYEEGINVIKELNLTQNDLDYYYKEAGLLYKRVKKEYPDSPAAQTIAYVIDDVKIRKEPETKSQVIKRVPAGTLVKIIDRSEKKEAISNMYNFWFKIKLNSGLEGWIYGFYLKDTY